MRTLYGTSSCVVALAALTFACGGSGSSNLVGPTNLVAPTAIADAGPTQDLSGTWRGSFSQSNGRPYPERTPYPGQTERGPYPSYPQPPPTFGSGNLRLSLVQVGTQVSGTGDAGGPVGCMLGRFDVTGSVTGGSFSLKLTDSANVGTTVYASGVVASGLLNASLSSSRSGCQDWNGSSSLNRDRDPDRDRDQ